MSATIGLDLGSRAVRAVQVSTGRRGPVLEQLAQVELPAGVIADGEVSDSDTLVEALKQLWRRGGFKSRKVALGIANQQVIVRQVELPTLPPDLLKQSLSYQAQEHIPIPVEQAILDCHVIEDVAGESQTPTSRVLLVAAHRATVETLVSVVQRAKLRPVGLDLEAFAALRALVRPAGPGATRDGAQLLVHLGASITNVVVHIDGKPRFVRILPLGGNAVTEALVADLGYSEQEAEQRKASPSSSGPDGPSWSDGDDAAGIISQRTDRLIEEIRGSSDYYAAQPGAVSITSILISGGPSRMPDLDARLAAALGMPVTVGRPLAGVTVGATGLPDEELVRAEPYLSVALGLALGAPA